MNLLYIIVAFALSSFIIYALFRFLGAKIAGIRKRRGKSVDAALPYKTASICISMCFGVMTVLFLYTTEALSSRNYENRTLRYELEELQEAFATESPSNQPTSRPTAAPSSAPSVKSELPASPVNETANPSSAGDETMVWASESGSKYHQDKTCSNMSNPQQISLHDAEEMGLSPCKRCYP